MDLLTEQEVRDLDEMLAKVTAAILASRPIQLKPAPIPSGAVVPSLPTTPPVFH